MQSEDFKEHDKAASGAASISREGWDDIVRGLEKEKLEAWEQSQRDMVGFLFELPEFLNPHVRMESREQKEIFNNLTDYLREQVRTFEHRDSILCLANDYGMAAEECGFRNGFAMAMRICMQGMAGGAY